MTELRKDLVIGSLFISGIFGFMSGEFIVSTIMFASAATFSNMEHTLKRR